MFSNMDILLLLAVVTHILCVALATINDDTYRVERVYDKKYTDRRGDGYGGDDGYGDDGYGGDDAKDGDYKEGRRKGGRYYYGGKYSGKAARSRNLKSRTQDHIDVGILSTKWEIECKHIQQYETG